MQDRSNKKFFFERREKRYFNLIHSIQVQIKCHKHKKLISLTPCQENTFRSIKYNNNTFKIIDGKFMEGEFAKPITPNLIIGNFPYFENEV